jgi:hypothetical protein
VINDGGNIDDCHTNQYLDIQNRFPFEEIESIVESIDPDYRLTPITHKFHDLESTLERTALD